MQNETIEKCMDVKLYVNITTWSLNVWRQLGSAGGQQRRLLESLRDSAADLSYQLLL
jgi:hypothetical protein